MGPLKKVPGKKQELQNAVRTKKITNSRAGHSDGNYEIRNRIRRKSNESKRKVGKCVS